MKNIIKEKLVEFLSEELDNLNQDNVVVLDKLEEEIDNLKYDLDEIKCQNSDFLTQEDLDDAIGGLSDDIEEVSSTLEDLQESVEELKHQFEIYAEEQCKLRKVLIELCKYCTKQHLLIDNEVSE